MVNEAGLLWAYSPALPKSATGELMAGTPNKKILTIQIRPGKIITGVAKRRAEDWRPYQCGCLWFCLVGRVTPCAPLFSIAIHDSRENTATAFRLPPTISVRLC